MDFQVETDMRVKFQEEIQKLFGSPGIEVECPVEPADILAALAMASLQPFSAYGAG